MMAKRLMDYLSKNKLLTECQFGFRPQYSTELAVHRLCQHIYDTMDRKQFQIALFCDLTKAFDTISHTILLEKLEVYGIRGKANNWFHSYLSNRQRYTVYNNEAFSYNHIGVGVPQDSTLGPILFLIYISDIVQSTNLLNFIIFADDTNIFISGTDIKEQESTKNRGKSRHQLDKK